ncbi:hypothetical protein V4V57_003545 [Vibrio mimicus]
MKKRLFWVGKNSPPNESVTVLDVEKMTNYRFAPVHNSQYREVKCIEKPISDYANWPFLVDELLRLGSESCTFELLLSLGDPKFSIATFYKQIFKRTKGKCKILKVENVNDMGGTKITFSVQRKVEELSKNWTFGVIWDGNGKEKLIDFIASIDDQYIDDEAIEILVCGPKIPLDYDITFIESPCEAEELSNISQKKNLIVKHARYENLCIVHNRYKLDRNFISSFIEFGYDFEMCIVPQVLHSTGERVPDWVTQASDHLLTKNYWLDYGEYSPFQYSPGGLTIAKKAILETTPWNELATWNMAEDVELSQRLRNEGLVYKLNDITTARVLSLRQEIINDFHPASIESYYRNVDQFGIVSKRSKLLNRFKSFIRRKVLN